MTTVHDRLKDTPDLLQKIENFYSKEDRYLTKNDILRDIFHNKSTVNGAGIMLCNCNKSEIVLALASILVHMMNDNVEISELTDDQVYHLFTLSKTIYNIVLGPVEYKIERWNNTNDRDAILAPLVKECKLLFLNVVLSYQKQ